MCVDEPEVDHLQEGAAVAVAFFECAPFQAVGQGAALDQRREDLDFFGRRHTAKADVPIPAEGLDCLVSKSKAGIEVRKRSVGRSGHRQGHERYHTGV